MPAELRRRRQPCALQAGGVSRPRARLLPRQLFPPKGPPLKRGRDGRSGGGVASWRGDCFVAPLLAMTNFAVIASEAKQSPVIGVLTEGGAVFELDRFIEECRAAVREDASHKAGREGVARSVSDLAEVLARLR